MATLVAFARHAAVNSCSAVLLSSVLKYKLLLLRKWVLKSLYGVRLSKRKFLKISAFDFTSEPFHNLEAEDLFSGLVDSYFNYTTSFPFFEAHATASLRASLSR